MTEIEKIQRAQMYIDKLANGINPIDGKTVSQNDVINNERISKCLLYVSEVLNDVIKISERKASQNIAKKIPFFLSADVINNLVFSEIPLTVGEITKYLNSLADLNSCYKLKTTDIVNWLVEVGLLEKKINYKGKETSCPTSFGVELGISAENCSGLYGNYTVVLYNQSAQKFIVDNIEAIVEFRTQKISAKNQGTPWTDEQEEVLKIMFSEKKTVAEIAEALKRSTGGIRARLKRLGLIENRKDVN